MWASLLFVTFRYSFPVMEVENDHRFVDVFFSLIRACIQLVRSFQGVGSSVVHSCMCSSFNHELINGFVHSFSHILSITSILFVLSICLSYLSDWLILFDSIYLCISASICFYLLLSFVRKVPFSRKPSKIRLSRTLVSTRRNSPYYRWSEIACFSATRDKMLRQFQDAGACKHKKLNIRCRSRTRHITNDSDFIIFYLLIICCLKTMARFWHESSSYGDDSAAAYAGTLHDSVSDVPLHFSQFSLNAVFCVKRPLPNTHSSHLFSIQHIHHWRNDVQE